MVYKSKVSAQLSKVGFELSKILLFNYLIQ